jgi:hypothetical protein
MVILRPHLTLRVLDAMSLSAWHRHGSKGVDPIEAARAASEVLNNQARPAPKAKN